MLLDLEACLWLKACLLGSRVVTYHSGHCPGLVLLTKAGHDTTGILHPRHSIMRMLMDHPALRSGEEATESLCREPSSCKVGMEKWRLSLFGADYE